MCHSKVYWIFDIQMQFWCLSFQNVSDILSFIKVPNIDHPTLYMMLSVIHNGSGGLVFVIQNGI